ncbi:MAG: oxaloacetate decarboxylase subunit beta [Alcanivorax sp.]|jgi:oxaloacetate decarboxylase beta subunit|uniref:sodium ion-translocating decarboxylase subunit beta n=2 Tax=Alcanivoracaceae TaxID=224372 RepID=UPI000C8E34DB|nr:MULTISPECIES: sodium ion-translocating decarboxylase subunit beta [Alcanivorax]MAC14288.1 oxaloacetate decarboxylase subunit beta [Alcanivorax sp.]MDF1638926.1 sodium ion-translocating decarboxylase subunit beta [Alcanivorax jadensis]
MDKLETLWHSTGLFHLSGGQLIMLLVCLGLLWLAINKKFEPLLLLPIGFGGLLANIPVAGLAESAISQAMHFGSQDLLASMAQVLGMDADAGREALYKAAEGAGPAVQDQLHHLAQKANYGDGILYLIYTVGLMTGIFPLLIFMGVGAMTDFGPLLANPRTLLLGAAAQFGIFAALLGALALNFLGMDFSLADAAAIGIIGGADGPTSIYVTTKLAPELLGAIAVAAYSYMALVPIIQPPIIRALTTAKERTIKMEQLRPVSQTEKILFPILLLVLVALVLPDAAPLLGMFCLGNLMKESGVVSRLVDTTSNALINVVTIMLGLAVGAKLSAEEFLVMETLGILVLGLVAFMIGTATGVLMAKLLNRLSHHPVNPIIGAAGVSAVPMAARVANKVGLEANPHNFLLMHAMGPNVAGVIGSAVAAGVLLNFAG